MLERIADGRTDLVFDHLAGGGDVRASVRNATLLQWCAYFGDVSAIRHLLAHGESLAGLGPNFDLNGAAFHGHWRLVQFLIEHGADPNVPLPDTGETPLHAAASVPNRPAHDLVVQILLAAGADPHARTKIDAPTGAFMRDVRTRGETPLHRAAAFGSWMMSHTLIEAGAVQTVQDAHGDTPLAWASWHHRPSAILNLLSYATKTLSPDAVWTGDHGAGWRGMDAHLLGKPHL